MNDNIKLWRVISKSLKFFGCLRPKVKLNLVVFENMNIILQAFQNVWNFWKGEKFILRVARSNKLSLMQFWL